MHHSLKIICFIIVLAGTGLSVAYSWLMINKEHAQNDPEPVSELSVWQAPDTSFISANDSGKFIRYGRELIVNTAFYFGPKGIVKPISNGLNCQNCHLNAGTKPWGNNFSAVASMYPKFRQRSGTIESVEKKINDCFERSMNGSPIAARGREMRAMIAYIKWLGGNVKKGTTPYGSGAKKIPYMLSAADTVKGKAVYTSKCMSCHGKNGEGKWNEARNGFLYPPLWGGHSYNTGAGILRISKFAAFVKYNMPFGVSYKAPVLTDEEAWNVAAYVNTQARPLKAADKDWPDIQTKPVDHPFGPYADTFSEYRHKYGPFTEIEKSMKK